jgi:hypothetical protein
LSGGVAGFAIGYHRGRAVGWLEHYEFRERQNKARRDRTGRFIAVKANTEAGV